MCAVSLQPPYPFLTNGKVRYTGVSSVELQHWIQMRVALWLVLWSEAIFRHVIDLMMILTQQIDFYLPFVWGNHRSSVNSPHKGQWHGALMFSLICTWTNCWVNNHKAGDLRHLMLIMMSLGLHWCQKDLWGPSQRNTFNSRYSACNLQPYTLLKNNDLAISIFNFLIWACSYTFSLFILKLFVKNIMDIKLTI